MNGGARGGRTPGLSVANAALSQLSYGPESKPELTGLGAYRIRRRGCQFPETGCAHRGY